MGGQDGIFQHSPHYICCRLGSVLSDQHCALEGEHMHFDIDILRKPK